MRSTILSNLNTTRTLKPYENTCLRHNNINTLSFLMFGSGFKLCFYESNYIRQYDNEQE